MNMTISEALGGAGFPTIQPQPEGGYDRPVVCHHDSMDFILYLEDDLAYRADRVDSYLTVLWHPHDERIVGLKLKGFRYAFDGLKLDESAFVPLVRVVSELLMEGWARAIIDKYEEPRKQALRRKYLLAMEFANKKQIRVSELVAA